MNILLRDRRMADDYADIPLQKTIWYTLTVKQLMRDKSLRLVLPTVDEPLVQQMLEGALGSVNNLFVVDEPRKPTDPIEYEITEDGLRIPKKGPKHIGIAGLLHVRPLDTRIQIFASVDVPKEQEAAALTEVYKKLSDVVKDEIGREQVVVAVIPTSTHEKALREAGFTAIATVPAAVRIRKIVYDVAWYAL